MPDILDQLDGEDSDRRLALEVQRSQVHLDYSSRLIAVATVHKDIARALDRQRGDLKLSDRDQVEARLTDLNRKLAEHTAAIQALETEGAEIGLIFKKPKIPTKDSQVADIATKIQPTTSAAYNEAQQVDRPALYEAWRAYHHEHGAFKEFCTRHSTNESDVKKWKARRRFLDDSGIYAKRITDALIAETPKNSNL